MVASILFVIVFTSIYGLINWTAFSQIISVMEIQGWVKIPLFIWFAFMTISPALSGVLEKNTGTWALVTFFWMGIVFYLFLGSLLLFPLKLYFSASVLRPFFIIFIVLILVACLKGYQTAKTPQIREVEIISEKLPAKIKEVKIAVISDLHLYSVEGMSRLKRTLNVLKKAPVDMLISTGDLIEFGIHKGDWEAMAKEIGGLSFPLGKFAVAGNHEMIANMMAERKISYEFHEQAGFEFLVNAKAKAGDILHIVGIDEPRHGPKPVEGINDIQTLLGSITDELPVLVLRHMPFVKKETIGKFDLQISGHTHGGQVWPFNYIVRAVFRYINGFYDLGNGSYLYTTPGTGTWGPPLRIGTKPEITIIRLRNPKS